MRYRLRSSAPLRAVKLLLLPLAVACVAVTESTRPKHAVRVTFTSVASSVTAIPGPYVSVLDTVILTATERASNQSITRRASLARRDTVASFDLSLAAGDWSLQARVVSNNGSPLFSGATSVAVADTDVSVDLVVRAVGAVLVALPDSTSTIVDTGNSRYTSVTLDDRGRDSLTWSVQDTVPPDSRTQCGPAGCVRLNITRGVLSAGGDPYILQFTKNQLAPFARPITFIISSRVGSIPVVVRPF